ncbi:Uncharacterised protein [Escherichia coli]|uniref:Uncharacterized protein n=1 Tax=Escherichia coli TaxID=562 RepID=A0A377EDJ1_ECOLX|nr:Uncharacterised protein [Escherichia coli]
MRILTAPKWRKNNALTDDDFFCGKVFDGELNFALRLAREMGEA